MRQLKCCQGFFLYSFVASICLFGFIVRFRFCLLILFVFFAVVLSPGNTAFRALRVQQKQPNMKWGRFLEDFKFLLLQVSWIRHKDTHLLTAGRSQFPPSPVLSASEVILLPWSFTLLITSLIQKKSNSQAQSIAQSHFNALGCRSNLGVMAKELSIEESGDI